MTLPFTHIIENLSLDNPQDWAYITDENGHLYPIEDTYVDGLLFVGTTPMGQIEADPADDWQGVRTSTLTALEDACPGQTWRPTVMFWVELTEPNLPKHLSGHHWNLIEMFLRDHRYNDALPLLHQISIAAWLRALEQIHTDLLDFIESRINSTQN